MRSGGTGMDLLLTRTGISYRQLDYWIRRGWINPRVQARGSGHWRDIGGEEEIVLRRMARLVNAGMRPEAAAKAARGTVEDSGSGYADLGDGLLLRFSERSRQ